MMPSYDPMTFLALVKRQGETLIEPLLARHFGKGQILRIAQSKSALKRWRRSFEFHKSPAVTAKGKNNGNCNS